MASTAAHQPAPPAAVTGRRRRLSMLVAAFGTVVEWYDFSIFFYVSTSLSRVFFGPYEGSLLMTLAIGSVGFLFRPIGAMVFGHLGDRIGRKSSLVISASLMAVAMAGIALVPGQETWGVWGAVTVIALRCLAGFSVGAEYTGIMVFLMESAKDGRRGFAASWAAANSEVGSLLAVGLGTVMAVQLSPEDLDGWGWRVLFLIGGALAALMIPLRRLMVETETFEHTQRSTAQAARSPLIAVLRTHPKSVLLAFLISSIGSVTYFLNITNVPAYLEEAAHLESAGSLGLGTIAAVVAIVVTPLIGLASDRFGRRALLAAFVAIIAVSTIPAYLMLTHAGPGSAMVGVALLAVPAAGWSAIAAAAVPEQFTAVGRFSGMAIGYNLATVLFGGLSPFLATWLMSATGSALAPAVYSTAVAVLFGIPVVAMVRDMAGRPLAELDQDPELEPGVVRSGGGRRVTHRGA